MEPRGVKIWYDPEGDFLEVMWAIKPGEFVDTIDGNAYVKVDEEGNLLGFQIISPTKMSGPLCVTFDIDDPDVEQCQCRKATTPSSDT